MARILGTFVKMGRGVGDNTEARMQFENDEERLVAEQALLNYRELKRVMKNAPHGRGLAVLEHAVRDKGFEQMRQRSSPRC